MLMNPKPNSANSVAIKPQAAQPGKFPNIGGSAGASGAGTIGQPKHAALSNALMQRKLKQQSRRP